MDATRDAELELSEEEGIPSSAEDDSVGKGVYSGPNAPKSRVFSRYPFAKKPEGNRIIYIYRKILREHIEYNWKDRRWILSL